MTITFDGLRSRCTIKARCAASTARQTLQEQGQALAQIQAALARVLGHRRAFDEFQRDVGQSVVGDAALDQAGDTGVSQLCKCLALAPELPLRLAVNTGRGAAA